MNRAIPLDIPLESDRISGVAALDPAGRRIGAIKRLYLEEASRHPVFADVVVGGFLGFGACCYLFPWENLVFDPVLNGYYISPTEVDQITCIDTPYGSPRRLLHGRW